jgi:hypothetical protein
VKFLALPVKNLRSHRIRSILTSLGIAIALGGMLALVGLSRGSSVIGLCSWREKGRIL